MKNWRLLYSAACDAFTNMAVDEALFRGQYSSCRAPTLRIYSWQPKAFSLGYSQQVGDCIDLDYCRQHGVDVVRRFTAGQVIYHAEELTYSISCLKEDAGVPSSVRESFRMLSAFLLETYRSLGLNPSFCPQGREHPAGRGLFCFAECQDYDILVCGRKIGGSAQRRVKNSVFLHGSIPIKLDLSDMNRFLKNKESAIADNSISLEEALKREVSFEELASVLKDSFCRVFGVGLLQQGLNIQERELSLRLREEKYANSAWNLRKEPQALLAG